MNNIKKWNTLHCLIVFIGGLLFCLFKWHIPMLIGLIISLSHLIFQEWATLRALHPFGGYANGITLLRFILITLIFLFGGYISNIQITLILLFLTLLDGVDGFLARKFNHITMVGAYFDMETDALVVCVTSIILYTKNITGSWILLIGFMRYYYIFIVYMLNMHDIPERRTKFGPLVSVILLVSILISFILPTYIYIPILIIASIMVTVSFCWSFYYLFRDR